jgi:hypothetical protein
MTEERQRVERTQEERQQRRRRHDGTLDATLSKRLAIPEEIEARLKAEGMTPRWVNDEGNRLYNLTERDDYERVDGVDPVPAGTTKEGKPIMAHLLAKRTDFITEDREVADKRRREMEAGMMKGRVPTEAGGESAPVQGQRGASVYADKANAIGRENRIIE